MTLLTMTTLPHRYAVGRRFVLSRCGGFVCGKSLNLFLSGGRFSRAKFRILED